MKDKKLFWTAVNLLNDRGGWRAILQYCDELYADGVKDLEVTECTNCGSEYHYHNVCVMCETYNTPADRRRHEQWDNRHKASRPEGIDNRGRINP